MCVRYDEAGKEGRKEQNRIDRSVHSRTTHHAHTRADGSLGAETAALREPYTGTENRGLLIHTPQALTAKVASAHGKGYQVEVHAIGDRAMEAVLDALEAAGVGAAARPVVTHCQVMGPDLIQRMRAAGAVANIQPSFIGTDSEWVQARLAPEVQASSYCWKVGQKGEGGRLDLS